MNCSAVNSAGGAASNYSLHARMPMAIKEQRDERAFGFRRRAAAVGVVNRALSLRRTAPSSGRAD